MGTRRVFAKTAFMAGEARKAGDGAKTPRMAEELRKLRKRPEARKTGDGRKAWRMASDGSKFENRKVCRVLEERPASAPPGTVDRAIRTAAVRRLILAHSGGGIPSC